MKKVVLLLLTCFASIAFMSCNKGDSNEDKDEVVYMLPETRAVTLTNEQRQMVKGSNAFSYNLYKTVASTEQLKGKSLVMSPLSVIYVLGMLNDGAAGETEKELSSLFGLSTGSKELINGYCKALITQAPQADPSVTLEMPNIIATAQGIQMAQQFKADMQQFYMAEPSQLDFSQPAALQYLNGWCNHKTHGMIPSILEELDPTTRIMLLSAVYFKATWTEKFDPTDTHDEAFTKENGQTTNIPMMHRKALALYAPGDTYGALCLPYGSGSKWQMMVLLPNEGKSVNDIIDNLAETPWDSLWSQNKTSCEVDIKMPRFSTTSDVVLNSIISEIGAPLIFSNAADFRLMTEDNEQLFVSLMKQKAAIEVNEEGTKASAVTVSQMGYASIIPPDKTRKIDFHANRPFVYVIREASSGAVFFIGTYRGN